MISKLMVKVGRLKKILVWGERCSDRTHND
jgi:hypothetical protein